MNAFLDQRVLERLRAEYLEMPGMKLRLEQVQRLCGIEQTMCKLLLDALVKTNFLRLNSDGTYGRLTDGTSPRPRPLKPAATSIPIVMRTITECVALSRGVTPSDLPDKFATDLETCGASQEPQSPALPWGLRDLTRRRLTPVA